jgi:hypothetical protein
MAEIPSACLNLSAALMSSPRVLTPIAPVSVRSPVKSIQPSGLGELQAHPFGVSPHGNTVLGHMIEG